MNETGKKLLRVVVILTILYEGIVYACTAQNNTAFKTMASYSANFTDSTVQKQYIQDLINQTTPVHNANQIGGMYYNW